MVRRLSQGIWSFEKKVDILEEADIVKDAKIKILEKKVKNLEQEKDKGRSFSSLFTNNSAKDEEAIQVKVSKDISEVQKIGPNAKNGDNEDDIEKNDDNEALRWFLNNFLRI